MFILIFIGRLINVLRASDSPRQIAAGFVIGMGIGLIPSFVIGLLLYCILIIVNVNLAAAFLAIFLSLLLTFLFDPLFHSLGYFVLVQVTPLQSLWTSLYNMAFIPFTKYNNTVVMGSCITSMALAFPVYIGVRQAVIVYRKKYKEKIGNSRYVRFLRTTAFYQWFEYVTTLRSKLW